MRHKIKQLHQHLQSSSCWSGQFLIRRLLLVLIFFLLCLTILSADFIFNKVNFEVGQVSERNITAPRTISYIDSVETQKKEKEVLAEIADVYDLDLSVMNSAETTLNEIFRISRQILVSKPPLAADTPTPPSKQDQLRINMPIALSNNVLEALATLDNIQLFRVEEHIKIILHKYLREGIRSSNIDIVRKNIAADIEDLVVEDKEKTVILGVAQQLIRPNFIYNYQATKQRQDAALEKMEPVYKTIKKDQVLVRHGDIVTAEQIRIMEELGLYSSNMTKKRIGGLSLFVTILIGVIFGYLHRFARHICDNLRHLILLALIILLTLLLGKIASYYSAFIAPIAIGGMLTAILIDARLGIIVSLISSLLFGMIGDANLRAVGETLVGGIVGVYSLSIYSQGNSLARAGVFVAVANFLLIISTGLISQTDLSEILMQGFYGILGGLGSAVLAIGLLPYLENAFNITSSIKLIDLARPNQPLLQRLLFEAPGTYYHSILVGNMAESAASRIGADTNLVRVGAYYHDIGKIIRPYFFAENQMGDSNPHEKMAPYLSTLVITSHVKDGVELCQEYKLPQIVIDIVKQHHGTTLASYFYYKASESTHGEYVAESDFRYEGPPPKSREAALIMLADSCEAAVRSLNKPTQHRIESTVRKIIKGRLDEKQLDECSLTLKDLTAIGDVYIRILSSMFHSRIEYPDELTKRKGKDEDNNKQLPEKNTFDQGDEENCDLGSK